MSSLSDRMQEQAHDMFVIPREEVVVPDEERSMPMNTKFEQRSYAFDLTAEEGVITGRPIVYDSRTNLGIFDEIIDRGALTGADLKDVRFLVNHDTSRIPLARSRNNNANSTMQLIPDDAGMKIRVKLDIQNNTEARNLYSAIQRGDISGMSFMFAVGDEAWDGLETDHPLRHVRSISNVVEVSACTFPAYDSTTISIRDKQALDSAKSALDSARRSLKESLESETRSELELAKAKANFYLN